MTQDKAWLKKLSGSDNVHRNELLQSVTPSIGRTRYAELAKSYEKENESIRIIFTSQTDRYQYKWQAIALE